MTSMVDRLRGLPLISAAQKIVEHPELQMEDNKARICIIEANWSFSFQLNWDNGPLACARFLAFYIALPFFTMYGCYYNAAMAAVKLTASGVFLFRKDDDKARQLAANAVQHAAFAVYDFSLGFFVTAPLLYIPVLSVIYAVAPGQILRLHKFLTDKDEGILTTKIYAFVIQILTKTEKPSEPPSTPRKRNQRTLSDLLAQISTPLRRAFQEFLNSRKNPVPEKDGNR